MKINTMKSTRGFTIVELMVSLVILAMLMATVALAFNASVINYNTNKDLYRAMNTARQSLLRATSDIRIALTVDGSEADNKCTVDLGTEQYIYQFDSVNKLLNLTTVGTPTDGTYVLCKNVSSMTFKKSPATAPVAGEGGARNVRISMTVTVGNESQKISTAAVIRRYVP